MLKQLLFSIPLVFIMNHAFAIDCSVMNEQVKKKAVPVIPRWALMVKSKQRVYFHSAPNDACKIKGLFIIHSDNVTAYDLYKDKNKQEWVSVIYYSKRQDLESEIVEGWVKLNEFENLGSDSLIHP